ncbi:MAG TPA: AMP-binding protein [Acidimicrobiales bacterium]
MTTDEHLSGAPGWALRTVPVELEKRWLAAGLWNDRTLGSQLDEALRNHADQTFRIHSEVRPWSGTFGDVRIRARRLAGALSARGVGPGDPVAFQLPNWVEAAVTFYAAALLGAVVVPIVHFYGPKEVGYILRRTGVHVLVTAATFGHADYLDGLLRMGDALDGVHTIAVVASPPGSLPEGLLDFDALEAEGAPIASPVAVDPDSAAIIAYTSGTTADPKGVIHSHRTIGSEVRQLGAMDAASGRETLTGAPVGHAIGMLGALLIPVLKGKSVHLVDDDGHPVGPGEPGEIWSRGPDCCMGYTDPALTDTYFDDAGWYRTEDIGVLDEDGYLSITDRKKDVIIRGGENISAVEVEEQLVVMDGVVEVAVVAAPHERLGEQACAFVRPAGADATVDLAAIRRHLSNSGLAHQKWPEQLRFVDELPRTPSGKVKKEVLRQILRDEASGGTPGWENVAHGPQC